MIPFYPSAISMQNSAQTDYCRIIFTYKVSCTISGIVLTSLSGSLNGTFTAGATTTLSFTKQESTDRTVSTSIDISNMIVVLN